MKIPGFVQDIGQFFKSKSNWTGLTMIGLSVIGFYYQILTVNEAAVAGVNGFALLAIRDAIAKIE